MAKVDGPLFSLGARGKIGDAIVFFPWKGLHVVRQWLIPANPKTADQGTIRLILGALGRACSPINKTSAFATDVRLYMDEGATWVSAIIKYMVDQVVNDGTEWDALVTEYEAHTATADFDTQAALLSLAQLDISYKGCADLAAPGAILYLIAKFSTNYELLGTKGFQRTPYTTALASWDSDDIVAMIAEFAAA